MLQISVVFFQKDKNKLPLLTFLTFTLKECAHVPIGVLKIIISLQSNRLTCFRSNLVFSMSIIYRNETDSILFCVFRTNCVQ